MKSSAVTVTTSPTLLVPADTENVRILTPDID